MGVRRARTRAYAGEHARAHTHVYLTFDNPRISKVRLRKSMCTTWTNYRSNGHCELINQSDIKSVISVISAVKSVITLGQASVAAQELRLGSVLDLGSGGV